MSSVTQVFFAIHIHNLIVSIYIHRVYNNKDLRLDYALVSFSRMSLTGDPEQGRINATLN